MNLRERRSMQRKGWVGLVALAALPLGGVMLLSGRMSLFFVAMVAALLCVLFATGFALLYVKLKASAADRQLVAAGKLL